MQLQQTMVLQKWRVLILTGILVITLAGLGLGLHGCSSDGGSPTGVNSKQCEELSPACETCENNTLQTDPACATAAVSCAASADLWACLEEMGDQGFACATAINRACYIPGSACDLAWDACTAPGSCEKATYKTWSCEVQVILQNAACAAAPDCLHSEDLYGCVEATLGEDSECEHQLSLGCYQIGTAGNSWWQQCYPQHYACSQTNFTSCLTWAQTLPTCTATDQQRIQACLATGDLYSEACWQQASGISDACWETLQTRPECHLDVCEGIEQ